MHSRSRWLVPATVLITTASLTAACGGGGSSSSSSAAGEKVTLRVSTFGKFGYTDLYTQYMKDHPNVTVVETAEGDLGKYNTQLIQRMAAGSGAGDVVAIEEGQVVNFLQSADKFVNLQKFGSNELKDNWLPWKYTNATTADGATTIGLGTDVGGLAMCYRTDLFKKAGLPTDRAEVGKLWPTWDDYIATGQKYQAGIKDPKAKFVDSATNTYNSILMQSGDQTYFDKSNALVIESNPAVKSAWDESLKMVDTGLSAKLKAFSPEWNAGFKNGSFATLACPAWMTGYIKDQAGAENTGKWDITTVPGGGGNWGGSWLGVPTQSKHQKDAVELAKFLTTGASQLTAFKAAGNLPSNPKLYADAALKDAKNEYFNDAPVGELFVAGAANLKPVYLGAKNQPVRDAVENAMRSVEGGQRSAGDGWSEAVKAATKAAK